MFCFIVGAKSIEHNNIIMVVALLLLLLTLVKEEVELGSSTK
jgi:hypothetical protein